MVRSAPPRLVRGDPPNRSLPGLGDSCLPARGANGTPRVSVSPGPQQTRPTVEGAAMFQDLRGASLAAVECPFESTDTRVRGTSRNADGNRCAYQISSCARSP